MADDLDAKIKLSQQLVMTPQLQMAIKLLATPTSELAIRRVSNRQSPAIRIRC